MKTQNIGGGIFNSNCAEILQPIKFKNGTLKVGADCINDTHYLYFNDAPFASHPNGYSCHSLASRLVLGDENKIKEQADYIVRCGGDINYIFLENLIKL
jgi:hypothetical protein